jgi:LCP family protein required for cell wall assembly
MKHRLSSLNARGLATPHASHRPRLGRVGGAVGLAAVLAFSMFGPASSAATKTTVKAGTKGKGRTTPAPPSGKKPGPAAPFLWSGETFSPDYGSVKSFEEATTQLAPNNRLFTALMIGSDARPGQKITGQRADSIHLLIIGFPRDLEVTFRGKKEKINAVLAKGGPEAVVTVINGLTKFPELRTDRYVVTGFDGFVKMVDDIGGVNVLVNPTMNDAASGARFAAGWHAMNGKGALAFTRNRKSGVQDDPGRSRNQGLFLRYMLQKLQAETSTVADLEKWVTTFRRNTQTNFPVRQLLVLALMARGSDAAQLNSVVIPTRVVKGNSNLPLDATKVPGLLEDVRRDGVLNGR